MPSPAPNPVAAKLVAAPAPETDPNTPEAGLQFIAPASEDINQDEDIPFLPGLWIPWYCDFISYNHIKNHL